MAFPPMSQVSPSRYSKLRSLSLSASSAAFIPASVKPSASVSLASPPGPSIALSLGTLRAREPFSATAKVSRTRRYGCCSGSSSSAVALANCNVRPDGERSVIRLGFPSKGAMADHALGLLELANDVMREFLSGDLCIGIGCEYEQVVVIPYISAGDPDLSATAQDLKVLDTCGSDIFELGVLYSDPLADGPVIQAAATRSLARGSNFDAITYMRKVV